MDYLSKAQEDSLKMSRTGAVYERTNTVIDKMTGEIVAETSQTLKKSSTEPDYIKLYYKVMLAFNGCADVPLDFIIAISGFMTWANGSDQMVFKNDKLTKGSICSQLGIKDSMCTKYVKRCVESGLLFPMDGYRGYYYVNPFFIAKGKWENIKSLQSSFSYLDGKWECTIESEPTDDTAQTA